MRAPVFAIHFFHLADFEELRSITTCVESDDYYRFELELHGASEPPEQENQDLTAPR